METGKVIAAVRTEEELVLAADSNVKIIFYLAPNILTLKNVLDYVHSKGKKIFVHQDLTEGIGKDKSGVLYLKLLGVDGIISTRASIIKLAHEAGLFTVQRFFTMDSHSVDTTVEGVKGSKADMIELMPGVVTKTIKMLKEKIKEPIIAGGLIETADEVNDAILAGAAAISTSNKELWK